MPSSSHNIEFAAFEKIYNSKQSQLIYKKIISDCITPVSALMQLEGKSEYFSLFESVVGGEKIGRYSIIATNPDVIWKCDGYKAYKNTGNGFVVEVQDAFSSLRAFAAESKINIEENLPKMASGIFGFMGYDMVRLMEAIPDKNPKNIGIEEAVYFRPQNIIIFDNLKDECYIIAQVYHSQISAEEAYKTAAQSIEDIHQALLIPKEVASKNYSEADFEMNFTSNFERPEYYKIIEKAKEYIVAGDIFQIVPSRRFSSDFKLPPASFYRALRNLNPSPYLFYLKLKDYNL